MQTLIDALRDVAKHTEKGITFVGRMAVSRPSRIVRSGTRRAVGRSFSKSGGSAKATASSDAPRAG